MPELEEDTFKAPPKPARIIFDSTIPSIPLLCNAKRHYYNDFDNTIEVWVPSKHGVFVKIFRLPKNFEYSYVQLEDGRTYNATIMPNGTLRLKTYKNLLLSGFYITDCKRIRRRNV